MSALYALDCVEGIDEALRRKPRYTKIPHIADWVYFYRTGRGAGRMSKQLETATGWTGPALVCMLEGTSKVYLSWQGKIVLTTPEQCPQQLLKSCRATMALCEMPWNCSARSDQAQGRSATKTSRAWRRAGGHHSETRTTARAEVRRPASRCAGSGAGRASSAAAPRSTW